MNESTEVLTQTTDTVTTDTQTVGDTATTTEKSVDQIRQELLEEVRKEYEQETSREIDRRVTEAIKKREVKLREEQAERERLAKLSESERLKELQEQKERELEERHRELVTKELKLTLVDVLAEEKLPLQFREVIDVTKYVGLQAEERMDTLKSDIALFKDQFNAIVESEVEKVKKEYLKGSTPKNTSDSTKPISSYERAKKDNDVRGMISSKLFGGQ